MSHSVRTSWFVAVLSSVALVGSLQAQGGSRILEMFQPKKNAAQPQTAPPQTKAQPVQQPQPLREDANRLAEIFVELAWLSDPYTFPFYLEARADNGRLEVRGNVPSRTVREQAVKLARLYSPLPVVDGLKENPGLAVRHTRMAPAQLQQAVNTALREAMPRQAKYLQARCSADGKVAVMGSVSSFEEKLAISQALHRLHGCIAVTNAVQVASDPDGALARGFARSQVVSTSDKGVPARVATSVNDATRPVVIPGATGQVQESNPAVGSNAAPRSAGLGKEPSIRLGEPVDTKAKSTQPEPIASTPARPAVVAPDAPAPRKDMPRLSVAQLKTRIEKGCPSARDVKVSHTSATEVRVEVRAARAEDGDQLAGQILSLPDLEPYRVDLHINLPQ